MKKIIIQKRLYKYRIILKNHQQSKKSHQINKESNKVSTKKSAKKLDKVLIYEPYNYQLMN